MSTVRRRQSDGTRVGNGDAGSVVAAGARAPRDDVATAQEVAAFQEVAAVQEVATVQEGAADAPAPPDHALPWVDQVAAWRESLADAGPGGLCDEERLALLRELELLTRTVAAVGAQLQVAFHASQVAAQVADGVAPSRAGKAVPDDLAQARLTSPYWGSRELTCAKALVREMPHTLGALQAGVITALQARVITEATTCVDAADRAEIDERLAPRLAGASTREIGALARSLVYEVDPAGFVTRARRAAADRGVSVRPCPDVMGLLSARLPAPQAIACYHALRATAELMKASGDPRTLAQLMADALFERLTGRTVVDGIDIEVGLVITDEALFAGTSDAAILLGYGPIPAQTARDLLNPTTDVADSGTTDADRADDSVDDGEEVDGTTPDDPVEKPTQAEPDGGARRASTSVTHSSLGFSTTVPAGHCPDGPRCTTFSCTLTHGHPAASGPPAPPDLGSLGRPAPPLPSPPEPLRSPQGDNCAQHAAERGRDPARGPDSNLAAEQTQPGSRRAARGGSATSAPARVAAPDHVQAASVWVRRLYTDPATGVLTERDSRKRLFTGALRALLVARDQACRNAWCGAPVRHLDHVQRHADQGSTDADNGRGLCARCNLARERPRQLDTPPTTYRPPPPLLPCLPRQQHSDAA